MTNSLHKVLWEKKNKSPQLYWEFTEDLKEEVTLAMCLIKKKSLMDE